MGWGNRMPLAELKRARIRAASRAKIAEDALYRIARLIEQHPVSVPTGQLRAALAEPGRCALCLSPYAECQVHR